MRRRAWLGLATVALLASAAVSGCGAGGSSPGAAAGSGRSGDQATGTLTVLAASSLTGTFGALARDFEAEHPGVRVRLSFDSSATLAEQVVQGAPADVLATADPATMATVTAQHGTAGTPRVFATNHLQLVVPRKNPARVHTFADLGKPGVRYVVCVPTAPCGKLARTVLSATHTTAKPASEEVDVKAVLSKVAMDEADAGLVYATDALAGGPDVTAVDVPTTAHNLTRYPVAALSAARQPTLARQFVALVLSAKGRTVLSDAGFGRP